MTDQVPSAELVEQSRAKLEAGLAAIEAARRTTAEARDQVAEARLTVEHAVATLGASWELAEQQPDFELLGRLYWEYTEIPTAVLARAFRVKGGPGAVYRLVPSAGDVEHKCYDCGATTRVGFRNRTEAHTSRRLGGVCKPCQAERNARSDEMRAQMATDRAEFQRRLREDGQVVTYRRRLEDGLIESVVISRDQLD